MKILILTMLLTCIGCTSWGGAQVTPVTGKPGEYYISRTKSYWFFGSTHTIVHARVLDEGEFKGRFVEICDATPALSAASIKRLAIQARDKAQYCKEKGHTEKYKAWKEQFGRMRRLHQDITKKDADIPEIRNTDEARAEKRPKEDGEYEGGWGQ